MKGTLQETKEKATVLNIETKLLPNLHGLRFDTMEFEIRELVTMLQVNETAKVIHWLHHAYMRLTPKQRS